MAPALAEDQATVPRRSVARMPVEVRVTTAALLVNNWNCAAPARTRRIPTVSVDRISPSNTVAPVAVGTALIWARSAAVTTPSGAAGTPQAVAEISDTADTSAKDRCKGTFTKFPKVVAV